MSLPRWRPIDFIHCLHVLRFALLPLLIPPSAGADLLSSAHLLQINTYRLLSYDTVKLSSLTSSSKCCYKGIPLLTSLHDSRKGAISLENYLESGPGLYMHTTCSFFYAFRDWKADRSRNLESLYALTSRHSGKDQALRNTGDFCPYGLRFDGLWKLHMHASCKCILEIA